MEIAEDASSEARARELEEQFARENNALPERFEEIDGNIYYHQPVKGGEKLIYVCSQIEVIACTRDEHNKNHGRLVAFFDPDGHKHEVAIPMELLASDGSLYRAQLLNRGLCIAPDAKARQLLSLLIQTFKAAQKVRCVNKIGWYKSKFILPLKSLEMKEAKKFCSKVQEPFKRIFQCQAL